jgi:hypothetical protein
MTTATVDRDLPSTTPSRIGAPRTRAMAARRGFLVASPVLAGLLAVVGAYADPAAGLSGAEMQAIYAANPGPLQFKSLGFHWAYAFWFLPALLVAPYVRGMGAWLANVTAVVGFVGISTLPGLLMSDWFESAIGQAFGPAGNVAVTSHLDQMWGVPVMTLPGIVCLVLALPLTAITLMRAGLTRWWALAAVVAGFAAFMGSNVMWWGCAIMTGCFAVFAYALARATR